MDAGGWTYGDDRGRRLLNEQTTIILRTRTDIQEQTWTIEEGHCWMLDAGRSGTDAGRLDKLERTRTIDRGRWTVGNGCWTIEDKQRSYYVPGRRDLDLDLDLDR